jgi:glycosyltransferase involved in cell wall biosynthesis
VVIDEINTMPFFTPFWAGIPIVSLIFQLAREVWWYESKFPLNALGFLLEPWYLRAYRHVPSVTISNSTKCDLERLGFTYGITVIPIGIEQVRIDAIAKSAIPSFLYVGRLAPSKRIRDIIEAFGIFHRGAGSGRLVLIGEGDPRYTKELQRLIEIEALEGSVELLGRVSAGEKQRRMMEAHVLLVASVREGWGLVVTEANACGTPAIVYDVPGLRDAVRHGETGIIVEPKPRKMAEAMFLLWTDIERYRRLSAAALTWSQQFSPDTAAEAFRAALVRVLQGQRIGVSGPSQSGAA